MQEFSVIWAHECLTEMYTYIFFQISQIEGVPKPTYMSIFIIIHLKNIYCSYFDHYRKDTCGRKNSKMGHPLVYI